MEIYLINIALILFWRVYFTHRRFPNERKYFCGIVAFQWILISGLRDVTIGADTQQYYNLFEGVKGTSWPVLLRALRDSILGLNKEFDVGYYVLTKLFQLFSGNYQLFLITIAAFFMTLMAIWIYRNSSSPCTSFILFSTLFFPFETLNRQVLAVSLVVFYGYELIKQRKFWQFMAVAAVAFMIHKSSLVFVPMYFIARIPLTIGYMIINAIVIILVAVRGEDLYGPVARWIGYESYLDYTEGGAELYATLLVVLCILTWLMYPRIRNHREDAPLLYHINSLMLITGFLVFYNQSFMRIQLYYSIFLMITVPELINTLKREYRLLAYFVFGGVMIFYLILQNPQYKFCFMN